MKTASAIACPNIAFIKYWGNRDDHLRLPSTGSISMNLDGLFARTTVSFLDEEIEDSLSINGTPVFGPALTRVHLFLDLVRAIAGKTNFANVSSENNFPIKAGIASSAAAFAALSLAATHALDLDLDEIELSRLARRGSGSACRSIPGGFVEWEAGNGDLDSYAHSIAPPDYWDLVDHIALVNSQPKQVGSSEGHTLAGTSPFQAERITGANQRLDVCRKAILDRDFLALADISELDSNMMHAVIMTSDQRLNYWGPGSIAVMQAVVSWRKNNLPVFYTLDAGPNVHVICPAEAAGQIFNLLNTVPGVEKVITAKIGAGAHLVEIQNKSDQNRI